MTFQSTVRANLASGVVGELAFQGPLRAKTYRLNSASAANNVFGRAFTATGVQDEVQAGGTGAYAGIMCNPKEAALTGVAGDPLAASLTLKNGAQAQLLEMGEIFLVLPGVAAVGDPLKFAQATGIISAGAPGAGETAIPASVVTIYPGDAASGYTIIAKVTG